MAADKTSCDQRWRANILSMRIVVLASNYGLWAEELQAPWDMLQRAGHGLTLATRYGKTPLPIVASMDSNYMDPVQHTPINPPEIVKRTVELLNGPDWANPIRYTDIQMRNYDAIVMVGGPGAALDMVGNLVVHRAVLEAYQEKKLIAALCY